MEYLIGVFFIVGAWIGGAIGFLCGYKFVIGELKQKKINND